MLGVVRYYQVAHSFCSAMRVKLCVRPNLIQCYILLPLYAQGSCASSLIHGLRPAEHFTCFPGVVTGGVVNTLLECHGNWAAAVRMMDDNVLPRPPLTVTYNVNLTFHDVTPPDTPLLLKAQVPLLS